MFVLMCVLKYQSHTPTIYILNTQLLVGLLVMLYKRKIAGSHGKYIL